MILILYNTGNPGESWQGVLRNGTPGAPMDFRNKWNNILAFEAVKKLPASALLDEDNEAPPPLPLTEEDIATGTAVPAPEGSWDQVN